MIIRLLLGIGILFLSSNLLARPAFVPEVGSVSVNGNVVTVHFGITDKNASALDMVRKDIGSSDPDLVPMYQMMATGLGIQIATSDNFDHVGVEVIGEGVINAVRDAVGDGIASYAIQVSNISEYPDNPTWPVGLNSHYIMFSQINAPKWDHQSTYMALVKNSQLLPAGNMYSVDFKFDRQLPEGTDVRVRFLHFTDTDKYIPSFTSDQTLEDLHKSKPLIKTLEMAHVLYKAYRGQGGVFDALALHLPEIFDVVYLTINDFEELSEEDYVANDGYGFESFSVANSSGHMCWSGNIISKNNCFVSGGTIISQTAEDDPVPLSSSQIVDEIESAIGSSGSSNTNTSNTSEPIAVETGDSPKGHPDLDFRDEKITINATGVVTTTIPPGADINYAYEIKNVDDTFEPAHDVYACAWLSKGYKLDDDPENVGCDTFDNDELDPGEKVDGDENFNVPTEPRVYNLVVCVHENQDKDDFDAAWGCDDDVFVFTVEEPATQTVTPQDPATIPQWDYSKSDCAKAGLTLEDCVAKVIIPIILD